MHRFCAGSTLSAPGAQLSRARGKALRVVPGLPSLIRVSVLAALGLSLLLAGCTATRVQTATETQAGTWGWCDSVQQNHPTVLCFQR